MDQGTLQGIGTILVMLAFFGICWWAYSGHKKQDFEEAAQLVFDEPSFDKLSVEGKLPSQQNSEKGQVER